MNPPLAILLANRQKFFARLKPSTPPAGAKGPCLLWTASLDKDGYGIFQFRHEGVKYQKPAHIAGYVIAHGQDPQKLLLHQCHRRACCNVEHVIRGGHRTNMAEMVASGRSASGSANAQSKLVEADVVRILRLLALGVKRAVLAKMFDVDKSTIAGIDNGTLWKHVPRTSLPRTSKPSSRVTSAVRMTRLLRQTQH